MKKNLLTLDVALSKEIKYMLKEEHYLPGDKLPSERKLAELFHVQRLTVRGALYLLLQDKTIISKPRSGYYVAPKRILQSIRNFSLHSEEYSGQLTYELYDFKKIEADNYLASPDQTPALRYRHVFAPYNHAKQYKHTCLKSRSPLNSLSPSAP